MNSLLPWIRFPNRSSGLWKDEKEGGTQEQPLGSGKPFRLRTLCKHVSDYEKSLTPEDCKEPTSTSISHFYGKRPKGDNAWEIGNLKVGKARTILDKAHQVNNKCFYPVMRLTCQPHKTALASQHSPQRFDSSQKENKISSSLSKTKSSQKLTTKTKGFHLKQMKQSLETESELASKLREFKVVRPFRSQWFNQLRSLQ